MKTNISDIRKTLGMTQEDLARKVGVTRQTIISLEQGKYNPSLQLAYRITRALGADSIESIFLDIGR